MTTVAAKYFFLTHLATVLALYSACHAIDECSTARRQGTCIRWHQNNIRMLESSNDFLLIVNEWRRESSNVIQGGFRLRRVHKHSALDPSPPFLDPVGFDLAGLGSILNEGKKMIPNGIKADRGDDFVFFGPSFLEQTLPGSFSNVLQASMPGSHSNIEWQTACVTEGIDIVIWPTVESEAMCDRLAYDRYQRLLFHRNRKSLETVSANANASTTMRTMPRLGSDPIPTRTGNFVFAMRAVHVTQDMNGVLKNVAV